MKIIWRSTKSNLYKMCHAKLLWIHIWLPLLAAVVFNSYFALTLKSEPESVKLYLQAIALLYPVMIAVVTTLVYEIDANAGAFQIFGMLPAGKAKGHIGNLVALLFLGTIASLLTVMGFAILYQGIGVFFLGKRSFIFPLSFYFKVTIIFFVINVAGYLIQYMLGYCFGKGVSLGTGIIRMLLGALMYLGIGDLVWKWIPCSYGIRMVSYYLITNTSGQERNSYLADYAAKELNMGILIITGITFLLVVLFCVWGNKWQVAGTNWE